MYELINVKNNTYYVNCPAKIGIYVDKNEAFLIDSGNDKDAGKKVKRILDENGWVLKAINNTHSHADHIGGNKYLQSQTGCRIFAKGIEKAFTDSPILEPSHLYGAYPHKDLLHKFLFADSSVCEDISKAELADGFEIIDLPGHSFDMIGIRTPDNVLFIADSVSSSATLSKYGIGYIYNVLLHLESLEKLKHLNADFFVPSHAEASQDISELIELNISKTHEIISTITDILSKPMTFEQLLKLIFEKYSLTMTYEQYVLIGSAVKAYLTYLKDLGTVSACFEDNYMLWKAE